VSGWQWPDDGGLFLVDLLAEGGVLDGEHVHGAGECFASDPVVVAFGPQFRDLFLEDGDLVPQFDLAVRDAVTGLAFGVEKVFEAGVLVGQLVAFEPGFLGEGDDVQAPEDRRGLPARSRSIAAVIACRSCSSVIGVSSSDDAGPIRRPLPRGGPG
jgi:hypothetical protein